MSEEAIEHAAVDGPVLVIGTGLIGTSIALALSRAGVDVALEDADASALQEAVYRGAGSVLTDHELRLSSLRCRRRSPRVRWRTRRAALAPPSPTRRRSRDTSWMRRSVSGRTTSGSWVAIRWRAGDLRPGGGAADTVRRSLVDHDSDRTRG